MHVHTHISENKKGESERTNKQESNWKEDVLVLDINEIGSGS